MFVLYIKRLIFLHNTSSYMDSIKDTSLFSLVTTNNLPINFSAGNRAELCFQYSCTGLMSGHQVVKSNLKRNVRQTPLRCYIMLPALAFVEYN